MAQPMPASVRMHLYLVQKHRVSPDTQDWEPTGPQRRRIRHKKNQADKRARLARNARRRCQRRAQKESQS